MEVDGAMEADGAVEVDMEVDMEVAMDGVETVGNLEVHISVFYTIFRQIVTLLSILPHLLRHPYPFSQVTYFASSFYLFLASHFSTFTIYSSF